MIKTVIKIGGSLGQSSKLADLMLQISDLVPRHGILAVPGGGAFADAIRDYDRRFGLDPDASHWMAVLAMDQFGHLISSLIPNSELIKDPEDAQKVAAAGQVPVLLTYDLLFHTNALPRSWDVTSDSIAAWVAGICKAEQLILLKSVDGLFFDDPVAHATVRLLETISVDELDRCGGVDPYIAAVLKKNSVQTWVLNGNYPNRLIQLLHTGNTWGTRILNSKPHPK